MPERNIPRWAWLLIAATAATVLVGYFTTWFGVAASTSSSSGTPTQAVVVRIVAFDQAVLSQAGDVPSASVTVQNTGPTVADGCKVTWRVGVPHSHAQTATGNPFTLEPGARATVRFTGRTAYDAHLTYRAEAALACENAPRLGVRMYRSVFVR